MAVRWRKSGELLCAAVTKEKDGDTYIDDRLHYQLSVVTKAIIADIKHENNGLWHWANGECFLRAVNEKDFLNVNKDENNG